MRAIPIYPAPIRFHWKVMIEFNDGNVLYGVSDDDLMERWGRMLGWLRNAPLSPVQVKRAVRNYLKVFYETELPRGATSLSNTEFLEAVNATKQVHLIRK